MFVFVHHQNMVSRDMGSNTLVQKLHPAPPSRSGHGTNTIATWLHAEPSLHRPKPAYFLKNSKVSAQFPPLAQQSVQLEGLKRGRLGRLGRWECCDELLRRKFQTLLCCPARDINPPPDAQLLRTRAYLRMETALKK